MRLRGLDRLRADFKQASAILRDEDNGWSEDFDSIRHSLACYIDKQSDNDPDTCLINVVQTIISRENDLSI